MKLLSFSSGSSARCGLALTAQIGLDLLAADPSLPPDWNQLFAHLERVADLAEQWRDPGGNRSTLKAPLFALGAVQLLPPVPHPSKIIAVGRNYRDHAAEQDKPLPPAPLLFSKAPSCLQGPYGPIVLTDDLDRVDAEAELAVIIGRAGRAIRRAEAVQHIAGYTCFNDVSDREAQFADKQWFRGKSIDTGGPCGPWIVTPDELPPLGAGLAISCRWNGELRQRSSTDLMIFPVDELIHHASRHMTLLPGDILATGTPSGVGVFRDPPVFLRPGDLVEVEIEGIGKIANPVTAG